MSPQPLPPDRDRERGWHRYEPAPDMITSTFPDGVPAPKRVVWPWVLVGVGAFILLVLCVGVVGSKIGTGDAVERRGGAGRLAPVSDVPSPTVVKGPGPGADRSVTVKDLVPAFKITDKQCFGSAGCNIVGHVTLAVGDHALFADRRFDVTYELRGVEDGPLIGSMPLEDGEYTADNEVVSTRRSADKITVVLTDVEERS